jgi:hypothetical protein
MAPIRQRLVRNRAEQSDRDKAMQYQKRRRHIIHRIS